MYKVDLHIGEDAVKELKRQINAAYVCGKDYGGLLEFAAKILHSVEDGDHHNKQSRCVIQTNLDKGNI